MSFGSLESSDDNAPLAEINMVPLIDVMLVLLVIFLITAPLLTNSVRVELPQASSSPSTLQPDSIALSIDAAQQVYWNGEPVDSAALDLRLQSTAQQHPTAELQIHADKTTPYEKVAQVMSQAARNGVTRIGFMTEPRAP